MKITALLVGFCCFHLASGVIHSHQYIYTATSGIADFPEFVAVGLVDGKQISYFDSKIKEMIPRQQWVEGAVDADFWRRNGQNLQGQQQVFSNNINIAKERFNQTGGVHTYQFMCGCQHDDESGIQNQWYQYGYDGEDLISFDAEKMQIIAAVPQVVSTKQKWENDKATMGYRKNYLTKECVDWLNKYVQYGRSTLERKVPPKVSLLEKDSSDLTCHATGFYPDAVMITWKRDGVELQEDMHVGETLPNDDGTFQKRVVLKVSPQDKTKAVYSCEVEHSSGETIVVKVENGSNLSIIIAVSAVAVILLIGAGIIIFVMMKKKGYIKANQTESDSGSDISTAPKA